MKTRLIMLFACCALLFSTSASFATDVGPKEKALIVADAADVCVADVANFTAVEFVLNSDFTNIISFIHVSPIYDIAANSFIERKDVLLPTAPVFEPLKEPGNYSKS